MAQKQIYSYKIIRFTTKTQKTYDLYKNGDRIMDIHAEKMNSIPTLYPMINSR